MSYDRKAAEVILTDVATSLKLSVVKTNTPGGDTCLQVMHKKGGVKVSVRKDDVIAFSPASYLGMGKACTGRYVHVTYLHQLSAADMKKAIIKALKDPKTNSDWQKELGYVTRKQFETAKTAIKTVIKKARQAKAAKKSPVVEKALEMVTATAPIVVTPEPETTN